MRQKSILIVDDEKNIRLTVAQSLESIGFEIDAAINGEEAIAKVKSDDYELLLLDLRLPGMDGMEVLHRIREIRPDIRIIIISAYGTIELAVKAMKLGAVDFIQKPFAPQEIREAVLKATDREINDEKRAEDYNSAIDLARQYLNIGQPGAAVDHIRNAMGLNIPQPTALTLMGALLELRQEPDEARKLYRAALATDPGYEPARKCLESEPDVLSGRHEQIRGGKDTGIRTEKEEE